MGKLADCVVVRVIALADGRSCPHSGRYVVAWNPHTEAGVLELTSSADLAEAQRFERLMAWVEWTTVSSCQSHRPWDGKLNRPLTGVTIELLPAAGETGRPIPASPGAEP